MNESVCPPGYTATFDWWGYLWAVASGAVVDDDDYWTCKIVIGDAADVAEAISEGAIVTRDSMGVFEYLESDLFHTRFEDCEQFDIPWGGVDDDCFVRKGSLLGIGVGDRYTSEELDDLCQVPCVFPRAAVPGVVEADAKTQGLNIVDVDGRLTPGEEEDWEQLIECAWALLKDNTRLIDYVLCTLSGSPDKADCVLKNLYDPPKIKLVTDPPFYPDLWTDYSGASRFGIPYSRIEDIFSTDLDDPQLEAFTTIKIFTDHPNNEEILSLFLGDNESRSACACAVMASLLLHEVIHLCGAYPHLLGHDCDFPYMAQSSFLYLLSQRYADIGEGCGTDEDWWWGGGDE